MVMTRSQLEDKIKEILGIDAITPLINNQITKYVTEYKYKYLDIARALYYFYVEKNGDLSQARGIGIVPYVYQESKKYFLNLEKETLRKRNEAKKAKEADQINISCTTPPKSKRKKNMIQIQDIKEDN